jgi:hypothetical protein
MINDRVRGSTVKVQEVKPEIIFEHCLLIAKPRLPKLWVVFSRMFWMKLKNLLTSSNHGPSIHSYFQFCARKWDPNTPLSCFTWEV